MLPEQMTQVIGIPRWVLEDLTRRLAAAREAKKPRRCISVDPGWTPFQFMLQVGGESHALEAPCLLESCRASLSTGLPTLVTQNQGRVGCIIEAESCFDTN